ncbi:hypothetical protein H311_02776 [Anncaliia algerae PRA109]|nr:hypothetical protein H311_02776 [Anncaliia algerae PRA109]
MKNKYIYFLNILINDQGSKNISGNFILIKQQRHLISLIYYKMIKFLIKIFYFEYLEEFLCKFCMKSKQSFKLFKNSFKCVVFYFIGFLAM